MPADSSSALHRGLHTRQTHIEVIVDVHLEDVLDDVPELALLQPEPLRDERDVAGHGDGGQLPREVGGELAVGEDGGLAALSHGLQCCHVTFTVSSQQLSIVSTHYTPSSLPFYQSRIALQRHYHGYGI